MTPDLVIILPRLNSCTEMEMQLPPHEGDELSVVDMHTGGEPLRIILGGYPEVKGESVLAKRRYVREHLDHLRRVLMYEPRGHYDMYGALIVDSEIPEADLGVLFMHNEGYSTMCGHAIIALGRFTVDYKLVKEATSPETQVNIHCPCGLVKAFVEYCDGKTGGVRFLSVPAFAFATDVTVTVEGFGDVTVDISYGGAFYAFVNAQRFGLDVTKSRTRDLVDAASAVTKAVKSQVKLHHPTSDDLAFLYGTILTDGGPKPHWLWCHSSSGSSVSQRSHPAQPDQEVSERSHWIPVHRKSCRGDQVRRLQGCSGRSCWQSFLHRSFTLCAGAG
ncbi:trans-L-3-hydroxyproline dehydratase isoform X3 [Xiphias gladius]|uniref:trans-L-3-hydroxyproline dehydratase isoform X3 n=1 Tax=Xiphias gladius TaxID=8245 RepID=UPI001A986619|nr:trans-L-3-hydroxyproline dehydratase isoform X3 [Xiphias gladius]